MRRHRPAWHYFLAGSVERARYEWRDGYSRVVPGAILYPWLTRREARAEAKAAGARAVFWVSEAAARAAMEREP